jgi:hypothetical protein
MRTSLYRRTPPIDDVTEYGHGGKVLLGSSAMKDRMVNLVRERVAAMRQRRPIALAFAIAGVLSCGGQSMPAAEPAPVFVGELPGTDARVALVTSAHRARFYFCGGDGSYATSTRWLIAPLDAGGSIAFAPTNVNPWQLSAQLTGDTVAGTVDRADGAPVAFTAGRTGAGTLAGLYEVMAPCGQVGVIIAQPARDVAAVAQGACINADPAVPIIQVSPLMPLAARADGTIAVVPTGADTTFVHAAAPPLD